MAVISDHIWYPGGGDTAYDLRQVVSWAPNNNDATKANVRFVSSSSQVVTFDLAAFEVAKQASLDAGG